MLAKNATIFTFSGLTPEKLNAAISMRTFIPCTQADFSSVGFVPPIEGKDELERNIGNIAAIMLRVDQKIIPASLVKEETKLRAKKFEEIQGCPVGRKQEREIKDAVIIELLAKAFVKTEYVRAWVDFNTNLLVVNTSNQSKADWLISALLKHADWDVEIIKWRTNQNPSANFTNWLGNDDCPHGFTIDDRAVLTNPDGGKVRITKENICEDEFRDLLRARNCIELALTHNDKLSFVLTGKLVLKNINHIGIEERDPDHMDMLKEERIDAEIILNANAVRDAFSGINSVLGGAVKLEESETA
ncbi:recombination-associated protein RdgC [Nitrosomonas sp. Nm58]|uniref:recombination-associated protein RdgC n=1 Tax=Nitrosomonas sp. Nm58 TaxID=200126 RepID=UPI0008958893|nr:recombination-associated protein RdgC [Nitrosomonas sp. Nm58]SDY37527.1 recombination associated protein RdgC [Nitrosomonas sp. Nm58]